MELINCHTETTPTTLDDIESASPETIRQKYVNIITNLRRQLILEEIPNTNSQKVELLSLATRLLSLTNKQHIYSFVFGQCMPSINKIVALVQQYNLTENQG